MGGTNTATEAVNCMVRMSSHCPLLGACLVLQLLSVGLALAAVINRNTCQSLCAHARRHEKQHAISVN